MKRIAVLTLLALFTFTLASEKHTSSAQQDAPKDQSSKQRDAAKDQEEVVRISVTLVQLDVTVTDREGNHITDLKPEDFEIYEDGRRQHITNFSLVTTQSPAVAAREPSPKLRDKTTPPAPGVTLRPADVRRTIALVVDDLGLSFTSASSVRDALRKFVDEQMQPGDLVAIIRTGAGMGALQQFTSDKRQLYAAIERIRWNPAGRGGISAFAPIRSSETRTDVSEALDELQQQVFTVGTLGAVHFIVQGLRELPGRKSVILFSDGFSMTSLEGNNYRVADALRRLTDLANRSSVVVYTIDAKGLQSLTPMAMDDLSSESLQLGSRQPRVDEEEDPTDRYTKLIRSQEGLSYLAYETGGFLVRNSNFLERGIERVLRHQKSYYLVGYVPEEETFKTDKGKTRFRKVTIKVKRPGARVRYRSGFYGVPDEEIRPTPRTPDQQLVAAISSPFSSGQIGLRLTSMFAHDPKQGAFARSILHLDASNIDFVEEADGWHKARIEVFAVTFGDNGQVIDENGTNYTIRARSEEYKKIRRRGFVYMHNLAVKKPGAYQLRIAVRDAGSGRIGSANQFIEVPDVKKGRMTLSGIVASGVDSNPSSAPAQAALSSQSEREIVSAASAEATPAVRRFRAGMLLNYGYFVYNAKTDRSNPTPQLQSQVRIFRDGVLVYEGALEAVNLPSQSDWRAIPSHGQLKIGDKLEPGQYILQIIVTDKLAKQKHAAASQWIDFEIVR